MKEKVLFVVNNIYLDAYRDEGGVRICTLDYLNLLSSRFEIILFPVSYSKSLTYRIRSKIGLNNYNDYTPHIYKKELKEVIIKNEIKYVFLNLSNTMTFATIVREIFGTKVKLILCSHGNESGDFLHHSFRFKQEQNILQRLKNSFLFAKMIEKEVDFRLRYLDLVLTVSDVEQGVECWLGAKNIFMVPRVLKNDTVDWNPKLGRVGFLGDLSHKPNYEGVVSFCNAMLEFGDVNIKLRLLGKPEHIGNCLAQKYSFVEYCGFVPNDQINDEVRTWSIFLNLVFYYSRGVSTKLARGISWGLPVLSTIYGNRGYNIPEGMLISAKTPAELAQLTVKLISDRTELDKMREKSLQLASNYNDFKPIMNELYSILISL